MVTGYVGGYRNPIGGYWQVRRSDAHAWAEVWLQGRGWVRVDPTAAVAPDRIYDTLADRAPGAGGLFGARMPTPVFDTGDWLRRGWNDFMLGFDAERQRRMLQPLGVTALESGRLIALFALAASPGAAVDGVAGRRAPSANPIRCCARGIGSTHAIAASGWAAIRMNRLPYGLNASVARPVDGRCRCAS